MIKNADYRIEIRFAQDGQPYYEVFRKDEPYAMQLDEYRELGEVFKDLSVVVERYISNAEKTEELLSARKLLENLSKKYAIQMLSENGKRMWVDVHNATGNNYRYCQNGDIEAVPMEGVWR